MENTTDNWFKKHVDTVVVMSGILISFLLMNSQFNVINQNFSDIEKDLAVIKTVLVMKNIMPTEVASLEKND